MPRLPKRTNIPAPSPLISISIDHWPSPDLFPKAFNRNEEEIGQSKNESFKYQKEDAALSGASQHCPVILLKTDRLVDGWPIIVTHNGQRGNIISEEVLTFFTVVHSVLQKWIDLIGKMSEYKWMSRLNNVHTEFYAEALVEETNCSNHGGLWLKSWRYTLSRVSSRESLRILGKKLFL